MQIMLPPAKYGQPAKSIAFYNSTLQRVRSMPGVEAAAISTALPIFATHSTPVLFEGQPAVALGQRPIVNIQQISPDYSKVMRVPLIAGRLFNDHDDAQPPKVGLVNQTAVQRFWPALAGILIGGVASLSLTRMMSSLLHQTSANDPTTLAASAALFTTVGLLASYVPARGHARRSHRSAAS